MGMTKQELIDELTNLTEPSRQADVAIAEFFNFARKRARRGIKTPKISVTWQDPRGKTVRILPRFTAEIDAAKSLCDLVMPGAPGGFSFHDGYAKAVFADGEPASAFNPATAICLAVVSGTLTRS